MGKFSSSLINIQRRGDTAQSRRRRCSIPAESVLNSGGFGAFTERYIHPVIESEVQAVVRGIVDPYWKNRFSDYPMPDH